MSRLQLPAARAGAAALPGMRARIWSAKSGDDEHGRAAHAHREVGARADAVADDCGDCRRGAGRAVGDASSAELVGCIAGWIGRAGDDGRRLARLADRADDHG